MDIGLKIIEEEMQIKRTLRLEIYKRLLNYTCAHPECPNEKATDIEAHHIQPLSEGGKDFFWNIISLCSNCHRHKKLHSDWESSHVELNVYKLMHESKILGFYMDEEESGFWVNYKNAIERNKDLKYDEKFVYTNSINKDSKENVDNGR